MTNAELIQKIRNEIERNRQAIRVLNEHTAPEQMSKTCAIFQYSDSILSELLSFLDTFESETKEEKVPTRIYLGSKYEFIRKDILLNEIERLKKNNEVSDDKEYASYELDVACGYDMACDDILSFLKPFAEVDKHSKNTLAPSKECEPGLREPLESEKPMNLEAEIKKEMVKLPFFIRGKDQIAFARHFAQWGAENLKK